MTRVWLSAMEWACCGDPFVAGERVEFLIGSRRVPPAFAAELGPELAATIDALEERHPENPTDDTVRGRVEAISAVIQRRVWRPTLRRPGHGAPPDARMPAEGELWPLSGRDLGNGLFVGSRPTRWMMTSEALPGAVTLEPCVRVPDPRSFPDAPTTLDDLDGEKPAERTVSERTGWIVDVEEAATSSPADPSVHQHQIRKRSTDPGRGGLSFRICRRSPVLHHVFLERTDIMCIIGFTSFADATVVADTPAVCTRPLIMAGTTRSHYPRVTARADAYSASRCRLRAVATRPEGPDE